MLCSVLLTLVLTATMSTAQQSFSGADGIVFTTTTFPGTIRQFEWIDRNTAVLLTRGQLWGSRDAGATWAMFQGGPPIGRQIILPSSNKVSYTPQTFLVHGGNVTMIADVATMSITGYAKDGFAADIAFVNIVFHPTDPSLAIGEVSPSQPSCDAITGMCSVIVLVSRDGGFKTWSVVMQSNFIPVRVTQLTDFPSTVYSAVWHNHQNPNFASREILYVGAAETQGAANTPNTYHLAAWNVDTSTSRLVPLSMRRSRQYNPFFLVHVRHFTFVAALWMTGGGTQPQTKLLVTQDNFATTHAADFPLSASAKKTGNAWMDHFLSGELAYSILDTSEGTAFIKSARHLILTPLFKKQFVLPSNPHKKGPK